MGTKTTKNKPIQTIKNDQIQSRMVRKNIHTSQQILPIHKNMQHLRIQKSKHNTKNPTMDMPHMQNKTPQRHQRSKKHIKRINKTKQPHKKKNKNLK